MKAIAQWFKDAWNLPWSLKAPFLGVLAVVFALLVTVSVIIATGGDDNTAVSGVARGPTQTATAEPALTAQPTATPEPTPKPEPSTTPSATPEPPPPAPPPALTAPTTPPPPPPPPTTPQPTAKPSPAPEPTPLIQADEAIAIALNWIIDTNDAYYLGGNQLYWPQIWLQAGTCEGAWDSSVWNIACNYFGPHTAYGRSSGVIHLLVFETTLTVTWGNPKFTD